MAKPTRLQGVAQLRQQHNTRHAERGHHHNGGGIGPADPQVGDQWWANSTEAGGDMFIYTGDEWVDQSLPSGALTEDDGDARYLSRPAMTLLQGRLSFSQG